MSIQDQMFNLLVHRIYAFLRANVTLLNIAADSPERGVLEKAMSVISHAVMAKTLGQMNEIDTRDRIRDLRHAIRIDGMQCIVTTARAYLRDTIIEHQLLKVPKTRAGYPELIYQARAVAAMANYYRDAFLDAGLPMHVIEELEQNVDALQDELDDLASIKRSRRHWASVIEAEQEKARAALAVLETKVSRALVGRPQLAARWAWIKQANRANPPVIRRRPRAAA